MLNEEIQRGPYFRFCNATDIFVDFHQLESIPDYPDSMIILNAYDLTCRDSNLWSVAIKGIFD